MRTAQKSTGLPSTWGLILIAVLAACGSDSSNGQTVAVNLSLVVEDGRRSIGRQSLGCSPGLTAGFPVPHPPGRNPSRKSLQFKFKLRGRAYPRRPHDRSRVRSDKRARDSCEHPSAGRAQPDNHGDSVQCRIAPSENIWWNAARRELDGRGAYRPRDHAQSGFLRSTSRRREMAAAP